jgi:hypothetical protein
VSFWLALDSFGGGSPGFWWAGSFGEKKGTGVVLGKEVSRWAGVARQPRKCWRITYFDMGKNIAYLFDISGAELRTLQQTPQVQNSCGAANSTELVQSFCEVVDW